MNDGSGRRPARLAEPVQVYLDPPDRERLERLTRDLDATKSDVLRRGLAALEALQRDVGTSLADDPPLPTFAGNGLLPGVSLDSNAALLDLMDRGDAPG